jgi:hypothetical protein
MCGVPTQVFEMQYKCLVIGIFYMEVVNEK